MIDARGGLSTARVLVLGANGFIGRRLIDQLSRADGITVVAAGRRAIPGQFAENVSSSVFDATDEAALWQALAGVTAVVNCIAGSPDTIVASARALFSAAARTHPAPRIIHLSSLAVYGSLEGSVDESTVPRGDLGAYSAAKLSTEKLAAACKSAVILRPGIVYGPRSPWWSDRIARLLCARRLGDLGKDGEGLCNLIYVDDVATAAVRALRAPHIEGCIFNLAQSRVPTWNEYFARYAQALGAPPCRRISRTRLLVERSLFAPALKLLEFAGRHAMFRRATLPPPIRPWLLELCRHRIGMIVSNAEARLDMTWTSLDDGLRASADWYLAGGRT
jgi:nucleoside-diphosphate-sugar epimerase